MKELKPYIIEFNKNDAIKPKVYLSDCVVEGNNQRLVIVITHKQYKFSNNNRIHKAWTQKGDIFLYSKGQIQGIMIFEFILLYERLNLASFTLQKREEVVQ